MSLAQILLESENIEPWGRAGRYAEGLRADLATERQLLNIEESCGSLDVSQIISCPRSVRGGAALAGSQLSLCVGDRVMLTHDPVAASFVYIYPNY